MNVPYEKLITVCATIPAEQMLRNFRHPCVAVSDLGPDQALLGSWQKLYQLSMSQKQEREEQKEALVMMIDDKGENSTGGRQLQQGFRSFTGSTK